MRTIHKFEVAISKESQTIPLPEPSKIVFFEYLVQRKALFLWVEVPADMAPKKAEREFRVFLTGDGIPDSATYVATAVDQHQPEVYHLYEMKR